MKLHTSKEKIWEDEQGNAIPINRVTKSEKKKERLLAKFVKEAQQLSQKLSEFKLYVMDRSQNAYLEEMKENGINIEQRKGNYTLYSFNRDVKLELSINDRQDFDDNLIEQAKKLLNQFISNNINSENEVVKQLVMNAFETSRGKLDVKKITALLRYRAKIKNEQFHQALDLIEKAIRVVSSKEYLRIWVKNNTGEYKNIELNFSNV